MNEVDRRPCLGGLSLRLGPSEQFPKGTVLSWVKEKYKNNQL